MIDTSGPTADKRNLEQQVEELRVALAGVIDDQACSEQVGVELAELRAEVASVQEVLEEVRLALLGNSSVGVVDVLDRLVETVETLGRLYETAHREGQLKDDVLDSLVTKLNADNIWRGIAEMFQSLLIARHVALDERA